MWETPIYRIRVGKRMFIVDVSLSVPPQTSEPIDVIHDYAQDLKSRGVRTVLDIGAGRLRNTIALLAEGFRVSVCDYRIEPHIAVLRSDPKMGEALRNLDDVILPNELEEKDARFDSIALIFVAHVIPSRKHVEKLIDVCRQKLADRGTLFWSTPAYNTNMRRLCSNGFAYRDGWVEGWVLRIGQDRQTFYSEPKVDTIVKEVSSRGFRLARKPYPYHNHRSLLFEAV